MLVMIPVLWILIKLSAPAWCFWCVGVALFISVCEFCVKLYKAGKESK